MSPSRVVCIFTIFTPACSRVTPRSAWRRPSRRVLRDGHAVVATAWPLSFAERGPQRGKGPKNGIMIPEEFQEVLC